MVLAVDRALVPLIGRGLCRDQFGDADQIVGDQVEQEIGSNGGDAAVLGLAHCTMLFAPAAPATPPAVRDRRQKSSTGFAQSAGAAPRPSHRVAADGTVL
jgi:hypothetical protein